ncbi:MAG: hypothetical protein H6592_07495 [Flavobacteriales bacterium]|nr:hypothetical protein [Flavobacteriales bacterium]
MKHRQALAILPVLALVACAEPNMDTTPVLEQEPAVEEGMTVMIQAHDGTYVGCALGGGEGSLPVLRSGHPDVNDWERFTLMRKGGDTIALQAANGNYVCADGDQKEVLVADRGYVGAWESFVLEPLDSGRVAIRTHRGLYVSADHALPGEESDRLVGDRQSVGLWERFTIIPDTVFRP